MMDLHPSGAALGARIDGIDLSRTLSAAETESIRDAIGRYGVLCFSRQDLAPERQKAFAARFGALEINVAAGTFTAPGHPEVMILSNIVEDGRAIGLKDAGQGWHADMSYSRPIAFLSVLHGIRIPRRGGRPLGATEFADMAAAYDDLPADLARRIDGLSATHDFDKFWEMMRRRPDSTRPPLSAGQRAEKPPVPQPMVLTHPVSGRRVLYCNPGYAVGIDGLAERESTEILEFLFAHQLRPEYRYVHVWSEGDVLVWDNIRTIHNAIADYRADEPRLMRRCQVMADRVFAAAGGQGSGGRSSERTARS